MRAFLSRISRIKTPCLLLLAALSASCSGGPTLDGPVFEMPETAVDYEAEIAGMPDDDMTDLAQEALTVFRQQDRGAMSVALLRRRAENDLRTVQRILISRGYYNGSAEVVVSAVDEQGEVIERSASDGGPQRALVLITVDPGTQFTLARHEFSFTDPETDAVVPPPSLLGSPVGQPAVAVPIVGAEAAAVEILQRRGYPYAEKLGRDAVADLALASLEVDSALTSGPAAVFGPVRFDGLEDVRERYLRTYIPWELGEPFNLAKLRRFQQDLLATELFSTAVVTYPEDPPEAEEPVALAVTVGAEERPFRTVSAGGRYSTDDGPVVAARFEHRNIWGENETVSAEAEVGRELQRLGIGYREPQYMRPGQDLLAALELIHEEDDAFDETRATLTGGLRRKVSPEWVIGFGGLLEASRISQDGVDRDAFLVGTPFFAEYDDTDDLLNPTEGLRMRYDATPFAGTLEGDFTSFFKLDAKGSTYYDILDNDEYVLAGRWRVASIAAGELDDVPANRRLYSGGGGSVRGYARRFVGPLDAQNDPIGGLSALELGAEVRAKLYGDLGGVAFVEAGSVSTESYPDFEEGVQVAAGFGARYYSPAGPIRVDVAFPVNPRDADDAFQFYFSIGQAF